MKFLTSVNVIEISTVLSHGRTSSHHLLTHHYNNLKVVFPYPKVATVQDSVINTSMLKIRLYRYFRTQFNSYYNRKLQKYKKVVSELTCQVTCG